MATRKQITEIQTRLDTIEDNILNQEKQMSYLKEMVNMQNKHIDTSIELIMQLLKEAKNRPPEQEISKSFKEDLPITIESGNVIEVKDKVPRGGILGARRVT